MSNKPEVVGKTNITANPVSIVVHGVVTACFCCYQTFTEDLPEDMFSICPSWNNQGQEVTQAEKSGLLLYFYSQC